MDRQDVIKAIHAKELSFKEKALSVFRYQYKYNTLYKQFVDLISHNECRPENVNEIPFLPISFFKSNEIKTGSWKEEVCFYSSGTTASSRSKHFIRDVSDYVSHAKKIWEDQFGPLKDTQVISLLPNYHENKSSSLIYMVQYFMEQSWAKKEQYFLSDFKGLNEAIERAEHDGQKTVLFGVSFALLDYLELHQHRSLSHLMVVETGGMKKHRREITRQELHNTLQAGFEGAQIISEYGMTECLSQMYCLNHESFTCNDWMDIHVSDPTDPFEFLPNGRRGRINIVDLANIDSMAFIATDDIGVKVSDYQVSILGRLSNTDLRGCNYLIQ